MSNSDYYCQKATETDDIGKIAKYIHLTDPYIYPAICENPDDEAWQSFICQCLKKQGNIYHLNNIFVIKIADEPVGIACVIPCGKKLTVTDGIAVPVSLKKGMDLAVNGYFNPLIEESEHFDGYNIVNVCVDEHHRGKGVGKMLMTHCLKEYGSQTIHLDVIVSNKAAVQLYQKLGFIIQNEYPGFSGNDIEVPCYHMVRPAG